jgi:hypothetical protein
MRLAFEDALRRAGYDVPEDVRGPTQIVPTWTGPRDRWAKA